MTDIRISVADMHNSCPIASKIKELQDTIASLKDTIVITDRQRIAAEKALEYANAEVVGLKQRLEAKGLEYLELSKELAMFKRTMADIKNLALGVLHA